MKILLLLVALVVTVPTYAQTDAKVLGMGGVTTTTVDGSHAIYNNPAMGLFSKSPTQVSSSYAGSDLTDGYAVSGSYLVGFNNLVMAGWQQSFAGSDFNQMAVDLGYARRIGGKWAVGGALSYSRANIFADQTRLRSNGLALDLSAAYSLPLDGVGKYSTLRAGAKLSGIGATFGELETNQIMTKMSAGVALDTYLSDAHELTVGVDLDYTLASEHTHGFGLSLGTEYNLMQLIQFRAGYHLGTRELYNPSYVSLGAGVRFMHLRLDFAYLINTQVSILNSYNLSFGFDF